MSYPLLILNQQLDVIRQALPTTVAVATELATAVDRPPKSLLVIEFERTRTRRIELSANQDILEREVQNVHRYASIPLPDARRVYYAGRALYRMNPRGAWCVAGSSELENPYSELHVEGLSLGEEARQFQIVHPMIRNTYLRLQELLPKVAWVDADIRKGGRGDGRVRRHLWMRFLVDRQNECCSIDTNLLSRHIRDGLLGHEHPHLENNSVRLAEWSRQLEVDVSDLPEVLHLTSFLVTTLFINRVVFKSHGGKTHA